MLHYFSSHPELQQRIDDLHRLSQELGLSDMKTKDLVL
jgi:Zn-dependent protease with chaperone function